MPVDLNYGRRTGASSFKSEVKELCETFNKFEAPIRAFVAGSGLSTTEQNLIYALIDAVKAACAAVQALPT